MTAILTKAPTWEEALASYEAWRLGEGGFSPRTWAGEKAGLLAFSDLMDDLDLTVATVDREAVSVWWETLNVGAGTKPTRASQLRSFLTYCRGEGWLDRDPTVRLRAKKAKPAGALKDRLDAGELLALLEHVDHAHERILLALCINLGLRASEVKALQVGDVDLDASELRVRVEKTDEWDLMPISLELAAELRRWLDLYEDACPEITTSSFLLPSRYWDNYNRRNIYRHLEGTTHPERVIHRALLRLGWATVRGEGVHTVRRSLATVYFDMMEAEESFDSALLATMTLLHHSRPQTTLDYIGRNRAVLARDRAIKGKAFLSKVAGSECSVLRIVK